MSTYTGRYSGSGKNPVPARGSYCEDDGQDTGDQKQPKVDDWAGGRSAKAPKGPIERGSTSGDEPRTKASS
jgi:hypothetical protein